MIDFEKKLQYAMDSLVKEDRVRNFVEKMRDKKFLSKITPYKIKTLYNTSKMLYEEMEHLEEMIQNEKVAVNTLDIENLKTLYKKKKMDKDYPNLNLERLKELYDNPPESLKSPAYKGHMIFDKVVVRKYIIAIIQMVFNNLDLIVAFCGREGTGKTTASTQDAYLVYWLLSEIGVIDYEYNLKDVMYHDLKSVIDAFNKHIHNAFRIFILDEGNELNRKNWSNPLVDLFFQKLRRERSSLRIVFINLPQLGELMPSITLSRVNFVFQLSMKIDNVSKLAEKGKCYFYIIPRFDKVYSYMNKKYLYAEEVINSMGKILDDKKKYLQRLPYSLAVHKFNRNGVWSFNEAKYEIRKKASNEKFSAVGVTLTKQEVYYLHKFMNLKSMGVKPGTPEYFTLAHLKNKKIGYAFNNDDNIRAIGEMEE